MPRPRPYTIMNRMGWLVGAAYAARRNYTVISYLPGKPHGTVKTVPYKPAGGSQSSHSFIDKLKKVGSAQRALPTFTYISVSII